MWHMERLGTNHAAGISIITFIVAVAISLGYYQFLYIPQANAKPILPADVVNPPGVTKVTIIHGASSPNNAEHFVPSAIRAAIGATNKVIWTNQDEVAHTVTSDNGYNDKINGPFDSLQHPDQNGGGYIMPGKSWSFTFTAEGDYAYHCVPHPFMTGVVHVVPNFA
jgi:plastocyanin